MVVAPHPLQTVAVVRGGAGGGEEGVIGPTVRAVVTVVIVLNAVVVIEEVTGRGDGVVVLVGKGAGIVMMCFCQPQRQQQGKMLEVLLNQYQCRTRPYLLQHPVYPLPVYHLHPLTHRQYVIPPGLLSAFRLHRYLAVGSHVVVLTVLKSWWIIEAMTVRPFNNLKQPAPFYLL